MSNNKSILVIDDSRVSRMMIKAIINQFQSDWNVAESADATQAIEQSQGNQFDYFSVDLNMPGIDGLELIEKLKSTHPNARFALLTANIQEQVRAKAQALGAACINKPITENSIKTMLDYFNA